MSIPSGTAVTVTVCGSSQLEAVNVSVAGATPAIFVFVSPVATLIVTVPPEGSLSSTTV